MTSGCVSFVICILSFAPAANGLPPPLNSSASFFMSRSQLSLLLNPILPSLYNTMATSTPACPSRIFWQASAVFNIGGAVAKAIL